MQVVQRKGSAACMLYSLPHLQHQLLQNHTPISPALFFSAVCCLQEGDKAGSGSTWEQILKAQDFKRRSFSDIDRNQDGYVDANVCCAVLCRDGFCICADLGGQYNFSMCTDQEVCADVIWTILFLFGIGSGQCCMLWVATQAQQIRSDQESGQSCFGQFRTLLSAAVPGAGTACMC